MEKIIKIKFTDDDSQSLVPNEPMSIVRWMRDMSRFACNDSLDEYMNDFAERYQVQTGNSIRCVQFIDFVEDLFKFGFLELVEQCSCKMTYKSTITFQNGWIIGQCNECGLPTLIPQMNFNV